MTLPATFNYAKLAKANGSGPVPDLVRSIVDYPEGATMLTTHRPIDDATKQHFRDLLADPNLQFGI